MYKKILKMARNEAGQVAIIFALSIIPIFGVAGFAIDFQNTIKQKQRVQMILDSAVLAAARNKQRGANKAEVKQSLQDFVIAQMAPIATGLVCNAAEIQVDDADDLITAQIACAQDTSLTRVLGHNSMTFGVVSTAEYGIDKIDVAFMFDVSGSMNSSSRITNLKAAAKEAIDVLLPPDAPAELIEDTRLAMVSYNTMVNAGGYFEQVTGAPATRTYTHVIDNGDEGSVRPDEGDLPDEITLTLVNADRNRDIMVFGDDAVIAIEDWTGNNRTENDLTIDVSVPSTSPLRNRIGSMRLELTGEVTKRQTENYDPYALYGDRRGNYNGAQWREGEYEIRVRIYDQARLRGRKIFDERFDFEIVRGTEAGPVTKEYTLTSTCVWGRDGDDKFSDGAPKAGAYLAHQMAWFEEDSDDEDGGEWIVGHPNREGHRSYKGTECRGREPLALSNDREALNSYVNSLTAGGGTAGHLGVAWSWYLISEHWDGIFTNTSAPLAYDEPDSQKIVILMTDGSFNAEVFPEQGTSDQQARAMCDEMKLSGVKVYAVALNAPSAGKRVLEYCANGTDYFFEPETAAELTDAYKQIATSISDLRISQ